MYNNENERVNNKIQLLKQYLNSQHSCFKCGKTGSISQNQIFVFRGLTIMNFWTLVGVLLFLLMSVLGSRFVFGFVSLSWSYLFTCEEHRVVKLSNKIVNYFLIFFGIRGMWNVRKWTEKLKEPVSS